ncbi:hypothetical protein KSP39_PZI002804 [Platanthera zijinensis]|uniref:Trichome birefringence-like N-terminal domain-containing protein n=1 Tax=Platanthera zijinensis TaxID=2320716 RepID=A0AAP0C1L3_9ASPA
MMKPVGFFSVIKFVFMSSLLLLCVNITLSLYTRLSIRPPLIFSFSSSSSSNHSNSFSSNTSSSNSSNLNINLIEKIPSLPPATINHPHNSNYSVSPPSAFTPSSSSSSSGVINSSTPVQNRGKRSTASCDISKGEWIEDEQAPYYSNMTCGTIQEHQNCMKYGRPDMDFLKWRWKPDGCELPLLDPALFLEAMRGKNLAFVGDSLARNQMQSLMCLLSREEEKTALPSPENLTRMVYPNHNFTIWIFWSPFLVRAAERSNQTGGNPAWNLYLDEPDPLWPPHLPAVDYLILNAGNWFTRPAVFHLNRTVAGCEYCPIPGAPFLSIRRANRRAFRTALNAVAAAGRRGFKGLTVVRTVSPSHFEGGEWNSGGDCLRTGPFRRGEAPRLEGLEMEMYGEQRKELWKAKWEGRRRGLDFRLMDTTAAMLMRPDGHPGRYGHWPDDEYAKFRDCVHWCLPGPFPKLEDATDRLAQAWSREEGNASKERGNRSCKNLKYGSQIRAQVDD